MSNKLVKDYLGNLVPRNKARKIHDKYYVEGESCFQMEDGQWYRVTSEKITFDYYEKKWILIAKVQGKLLKGIVNEKGDVGYFSANDFSVITNNKVTKENSYILNEEIALKLGYIESISDGWFYEESTLTEQDKRTWFNKKNIPNSERSKSYNLEADQERKKELEKRYEELNLPISAIAKRIAKFIGNFSFGAEYEVMNGFLPRRIRNRFGIKALKDGSLRTDNMEGIEMVTMPMKGAKGVEVLRQMCKELSRRCDVNNYCSLHFHFGNVRKDKLYTLSMFKLGRMLQDEMKNYFPFSRFNSIKSDGKVYCQFLPDLSVNYASILKQTSEEDFHTTVINEFNKVYKWLNDGRGLADTHGQPELVRTETKVDGKRMFYDKWLKNVYSTKSVYHSVTGEKWNRKGRYYWINFLNLYFSPIGTIEFRPEAGTTSWTKTAIWIMVCASILRYAEDIKRCFTAKSVTLKEVLIENLGEKYADYIMAYMKMRHGFFFNSSEGYREYKSTERDWFNQDYDFTFEHEGVTIK